MTHYITGIRLYNMFCARGSNECNQWRSEGGGQGGTYVPGRRVEGAPK